MIPASVALKIEIETIEIIGDKRYALQHIEGVIIVTCLNYQWYRERKLGVRVAFQRITDGQFSILKRINQEVDY